MTIDLHTWDAARLQRLLALRPGLLRARDLDEVATLASRGANVYDALRDLPAAPRQVLEALALLPDGSTVEDLISLDPSVDPSRLEQVLDDLRDRLLLRDGPGLGDGLRLVGPVRHYLAHPLGLGRSAVECFEHTPYVELRNLVDQHDGPPVRSGLAAREALAAALSDTEALASSLRQLPPDVLALLEKADAEGPVLRVPGVDPFEGLLPDDPAAQGALLLGLVAAVGVGRVELPREVGLALRFPRTIRWDLAEADLPAVPVQAQQVAAACAGQVHQLFATVSAIVTKIETRPVPRLVSGSIGVKEVRALAAGVCEPSAVSLVLRLLDDLGLVSATRKELRVAARAKAWLAEEEAVRWTELVRAWLGCSAFPAARPGGARPLKAALNWDFDSRSAAARHQLVRLLGTAPEGGYGDLGWLATWRRRWPEQRLTAQDSRGHVDDVELRADVLYEAQVLALLADGAASPLACAVYAGGDVPGVIDGLGGAGESRVRAQADMTLVCTGRPARDMQHALDRVATVEQTGQATVWRVSEQSLTTAYDGGDTPEEVLAVLETYAGDLPQAMAYLVKDAHRRHGRVRVGTATSYVVVEDDALLQDALAKKGAKALGLRRIAPGVAISHGSMAATLAGLRELGLAAVAETGPGVRAAPVKRAPARTVRPLASLPVFDATPLAEERARALAQG